MPCECPPGKKEHLPRRFKGTGCLLVGVSNGFSQKSTAFTEDSFPPLGVALTFLVRDYRTTQSHPDNRNGSIA